MGGGDTRDRKREMHGDKEYDEIAKPKKGKGRTKKGRKKRRCQIALQKIMLLYQPAVGATYLQSQFQFYGRGCRKVNN
jgi:hypothetical protein